MKSLTRRIVPAIVLSLVLPLLAQAHPQAPSAQAYFSLLEKGLHGIRAQMDSIVQSADSAAPLLVAGGHLYSGGPQVDFAAEAGGRSGGLMGMKSLAGANPVRGDVVLYARIGPPTEEDAQTLAKFKADGVYVVAFMPNTTDKILPCDALIDTGTSPGLPLSDGVDAKICPIDSIVNIAAMWTWTAELTAACTRHGKMPVLYQSYGMPNGRERDNKYEGQIFHSDMQVKPVPAQSLGNAYLDSIELSLKRITTQQMPAILTAAQWLHQSPKDQSQCWFIGHMFPAHFQDVRAPQPMQLMSSPIDGPAKVELGHDGFVLFVGYQQAPQKLVDQASADGFHLAYMSVTRATHDSSDNIRYIDPAWDLPDAAVRIEGYDIPVFPPSGVLDSAIYWAIVAQAHAGETP
ncbi:MAG: hypothetical protein IT447_11975 [Phycisphaerales bacterium]|jgi:hypothetical protein|nr:hypothetical protein [Phycisphaerales bacterium]